MVKGKKAHEDVLETNNKNMQAGVRVCQEDKQKLGLRRGVGQGAKKQRGCEVEEVCFRRRARRWTGK